MPRYEVIYLLCTIALGSWIAVWMFVEWEEVILGAMFLLGLVPIREPFELPFFLYPLQHIVRLFAIVFLLMMIYMAYHIEEYAENIKESRR